MKQVNEFLSPDTIADQLKNKAAVLSTICAQKKNSLKKAPEGILRVSVSNNRKQYYWVTERNGKNGKYIPQQKMDFAKQLAQKEYDAEVVEAINAELNLIEQYQHQTKFKKHFASKIDAKKFPLVKEVILEDNEYASQWLAIPYQKKEFREEQKTFLTSSGLKVRSKSEVIIAELLEKNRIPFRYEQKLRLGTFSVHPDFVCLNVGFRKEFVWEHLGMMDDVEYAKSAVEKIHCYQKNGYFPGKNLIVTMETKKIPLNARSVQEIINQYLK